MDIEELSRSQTILLTLLVSFVTSIATGIVTVSLMEQAPPALTQTVNRVIERTVEKVVPSGQAASAVTTEKTVVVKESDLIVQAVEHVMPSVVRVYSDSPEPTFLGLGVVLDESGTVITDVTIVSGVNRLVLQLSDGSWLPATVDSDSEKAGTVLLAAAETTIDGKTPDFAPAVLAVGEPALGQTVVVLSGNSISRIADGLVTALIPRVEGEGAVIDTNVSADFVMEGSPLVDTQGSLLGISTNLSRASSPGAFMPSSLLVPAVASPEAGAAE